MSVHSIKIFYTSMRKDQKSRIKMGKKKKNIAFIIKKINLAPNCLKIYSTSLRLREMQIKSTNEKPYFTCLIGKN
jgi:hypothetical protein